jgi:hypothetical protein
MKASIELIDPRNLTEKDLPLVVLSDSMLSFLGWGIKAHTSGEYSHAMMMVQPGVFASQGWIFNNVNVAEYCKPSYRLKFWKPEITIPQKNIILEYIQAELSKPWYKRRYDILGVIGQALNIRCINNPWSKYCSEHVSATLAAAGFAYGKHPSPSDLNRYFIKDPKWSVLGYWLQD